MAVIRHPVLGKKLEVFLASTLAPDEADMPATVEQMPGLRSCNRKLGKLDPPVREVLTEVTLNRFGPFFPRTFGARVRTGR